MANGEEDKTEDNLEEDKVSFEQVKQEKEASLNKARAISFNWKYALDQAAVESGLRSEDGLTLNYGKMADEEVRQTYKTVLSEELDPIVGAAIEVKHPEYQEGAYRLVLGVTPAERDSTIDQLKGNFSPEIFMEQDYIKEGIQRATQDVVRAGLRNLKPEHRDNLLKEFSLEELVDPAKKKEITLPEMLKIWQFAEQDKAVKYVTEMYGKPSE